MSSLRARLLLHPEESEKHFAFSVGMRLDWQIFPAPASRLRGRWFRGEILFKGMRGAS